MANAAEQVPVSRGCNPCTNVFGGTNLSSQGHLVEMSALWPSCREFLRTMPFGQACRWCFNLDPNLSFLNHCAYGAAVNPVLQAQAHFVNLMERNGTRFFRREGPILLREAATRLSEFLHADPEDIVFVTNATTGVNAVLRSVDLQEGDEVLCLNLTYPAVLNTLRHICFCTQAFVELKVVDVELPVASYDVVVAQVMAAITDNTRLAVLDHIAGSTSFVVPLDKLIPIFHERGIPVLVDGASAPGQLPLNLCELGADFYVGTCYKWLFGSKSCAFLYTNKDHQSMLRPAITSMNYGQGYVEDFAVQGTRDESNFLTIVTALDFYETIGIERVFTYNKSLLEWANNYLTRLWQTNTLLPSFQCAPFMSNVRLPLQWPTTSEGIPYSNEEIIPICDALMDLLEDQFFVVARIIPIQQSLYVRISAQIYNVRQDYERLGAAVQKMVEPIALSEYLASLRIA